MKNLCDKFLKFNQHSSEFSQIELYSKKISDIKNISSYINNNFKIKKSGLYNYIPKTDSYRLRLLIENNEKSIEYTNMIRSFIHNNKMKTAIVNSKDFEEHNDSVKINKIKEFKPLISMLDINLSENIFKKNDYEYSFNSKDFNDISGNYLNFVNIFFFNLQQLRENVKKIDIISVCIENLIEPELVNELQKHNLTKFLNFIKADEKLNKKLIAIKTSNVQNNYKYSVKSQN